MIRVLKISDVVKGIVALAWAVIGVPMSFMANGMTFYIGLAIALAPLVLLYYGNKSESKSADKQYLELLRLAGMEKSKVMDHFEGGTAIAIDRERKKILLLVKSTARAYSYDDVRKWTHNNESFLVHVRDIDNSQWKISMASAGESARWNEIFIQEMNERKD